VRLAPLPRRLGAILDLIPQGDAVADVGSGHGALAAHLAARGGRVIATEVTQAALLELRQNLRRWGISGVEVRHGRGLEPLGRREVDGVVVAGMGARTILDVVAQGDLRGLRWLLLQPMQHSDLVEPWLRARKWDVLDHVIPVQKGRGYPTWRVAPA